MAFHERVMRPGSRGESPDRGAVLAVGAAAIGAILLVTAMVVDLGSARVDRAQNQVITDAASAAGIMGIVEDSGAGGCEAALGYVEAHIGAVSGLDCSGFPLDCQASTLSASASGTTGGLTVSIVHPVDDNDPLMSAGSTSAADQIAGDIDGDRCDRLAVSIKADRSSIFAAFTGGDPGKTSVHSVARISDEFGRDLVINLLLLEPVECEALTIGGGGSSGGISVAPVIDPATGDVFPGRIALDSNGTGLNCGSRGTIHANGSGATILANGPPGCATELTSIGPGVGCGRIETYALGTPGCNLPACSNSGIIAPGPVKSPRRFTRAPIDHQFNCKEVYPVSYDIRRCAETGSRTAYIDDLVFQVTNNAGSFTNYRNFTSDFRCNLNPSGDPVVVPPGNWFVDCADLRVGRELTFEGGNIIFQGDLTVGSQGILNINTNNSSTSYSWDPSWIVDHTAHSDQAAYVFFQAGTFSKGASSEITMENTMVYLSATSELDLGGGSGPLRWTAPYQGPFTNLAMWSESALDHKFAGSAGLVLEGVFFAPLATISYQGNGGQNSVAAQFIANKASTGGNGSLEIAPAYNRIVRFPPPAITELIR